MDSGIERSAAEPFTALITEQLAEERATKSSLEQRGNLVITTAGTLATLLFALAALVTAEKKFLAPESARLLLAIATAFFVAAAVCGLLANLPWKYEEVTEAGLLRIVQPDVWHASADLASRRTAEAHVRVIIAARRANILKAWWIRLALFSEIVAIALVASAVSVVLLT
jgi:hypothetical protein